jgi:hypothetical protein
MGREKVQLALSTKKQPTRSKHRPFVAVVIGAIKGVPFRRAFKSMKTAERVRDTCHGELITLNKEK